MWVLVERYCENFENNDFRLVFKYGDKIIELSVCKTEFDLFGDV
jgi:hypothetical protein